jgi:very-short-patch-repair endonuclease
MKTDFYNRNMFYGANAGALRTAGILRKNMTKAELVLWNKLKDKRIFKSKFRRQHPIDIFIVDFYCHEYKLVIEIDGEIHNNEEITEYDLGRSTELKKFGITVLRFTNEQIIYNLDLVIIRILQVLTRLTPL